MSLCGNPLLRPCFSSHNDDIRIMRVCCSSDSCDLSRERERESGCSARDICVVAGEAGEASGEREPPLFFHSTSLGVAWRSSLQRFPDDRLPVALRETRHGTRGCRHEHVPASLSLSLSLSRVSSFALTLAARHAPPLAHTPAHALTKSLAVAVARLSSFDATSSPSVALTVVLRTQSPCLVAGASAGS